MEATKPCTSTFILHQSRTWTPCWEPLRRAKYQGDDNSPRRRLPRWAGPSSLISFSSNHPLLAISPSLAAPDSSLCRCATHMVETDERTANTVYGQRSLVHLPSVHYNIVSVILTSERLSCRYRAGSRACVCSLLRV
jgi:hypothetical protein